MEKIGPKRESNFKIIPEDYQKIDSYNKMEPVFFGMTKDGALVYDRSDCSHFHEEGGLTPELLGAAISVIDTNGENFIKKQVDFDQPIGKQSCVEVGPDDDIVMVYRRNRSGRTPMVKNKDGEPSNSVTVILKKDDDKNNSYRLMTGYVGKSSLREPWDPSLESEEEKGKCRDFWNSHALVYDDDQIDWERTKAYEFMSDFDQKSELIRQKTLYAGLFVDSNELYEKFHPALDKAIKCPHVTMNFKPGIDQLRIDELGKNAEITAIGYGNDGKNEGLLVRVESDDAIIQEACDMVKTPHITLSVSKDGRAKDTAFLEFKPLDEPFKIDGWYGLFLQGKAVVDKADLEID